MNVAPPDSVEDVPEQPEVPVPSYARLQDHYYYEDGTLKAVSHLKDTDKPKGNSSNRTLTNSMRGYNNSGMKNHTYKGNVVWIKGAIGESCSEACKNSANNASKCIEDAWPHDDVEFNWDKLNVASGSLHCIDKVGNWWGNPVIHSNGVCYLSDAKTERYVNRCAASPKDLQETLVATTHRICPCVGTWKTVTTAAPTPSPTATVWTTTTYWETDTTCNKTYKFSNGTWRPNGDWSACSRSCAGGFKWRQGTEQGAGCSKTYDSGSATWKYRTWWEHQTCNTQACPVDCVGAWGNYGACSQTCGAGTQTRTYSHSVTAAHGGSACAFGPGVTQTKTCEVESCSSPALVQLGDGPKASSLLQSTASSRGGAWHTPQKAEADTAKQAFKEDLAMLREQKATRAEASKPEPWRNGEEWQAYMAKGWKQKKEKMADAMAARSGINGRIMRQKRAAQKKEKKSARQEVRALMQDKVMDILHPGAAGALMKWWKRRAGIRQDNNNNLPEPENQEERVKLLKYQVQALEELIEKNEWSELHQEAAKAMLAKYTEERSYQEKILELDNINSGKVGSEHPDCKFGNETACSTHGKLSAVLESLKGDLEAMKPLNEYEKGLKPKVAKAIAAKKMSKVCEDANFMELPAWLRTVTKQVDTLRHTPKSEHKMKDMERLLTEVRCRKQFHAEDCESGDGESCKGKKFAENIEHFVSKIMKKETKLVAAVQKNILEQKQ